uniref:Glutamine cyclotransferase n=1 Tax=Desulfovibrio sp. U5L TaxID=596152 RepID=I2Q266_9BACT
MAGFGLKRVFIACVVLSALWSASGPARAGAPVLTAEPAAVLPHDAAAFTQGLLFHKGVFYESTGLYGRSSLRRVDPATGRVLARRALPTKFFGEGLALVGDRLYQLTWRERRVLVSDLSDLRPVGELPLPTEGWGACGLDGALVVSDGSDRLVFYDPKDMTARGEVAVTDDGAPVPLLNELEAVAGTIWANVWGDSRIAVIDPATGRVLAWVDCASLRPGVTAADLDNVLNGIAYDPATGRIWVTGKRWPNVYEIKVPGLPTKAAR